MRRHLRGSDILRIDRTCRKCRGLEEQHRPFKCKRTRVRKGNIFTCDGVSLYRRYASGVYSMCSVCPDCKLPPLNPPPSGGLIGT